MKNTIVTNVILITRKFIVKQRVNAKKTIKNGKMNDKKNQFVYKNVPKVFQKKKNQVLPNNVLTVFLKPVANLRHVFIVFIKKIMTIVSLKT